MKKKNLAAKIFLGLFLFTLAATSISVILGKWAYQRDPQLLAKLGQQLNQRWGQKDSKPFSESSEQDLKGIHRIQVSCTTCDLEARSYDGSTLKLLYEGSTGKDVSGSMIEATNRDGEIIFNLMAPTNNHFQFVINDQDFFKSQSDLAVTLLVPRSYTADLVLNQTAGDINIENINVRNLQIRSVSGDVDLHHVHGQGLQLNSTSGDISAADSRFTAWSIKATSGAIDLQMPAPDQFIADIRSTNGELKVDPAIVLDQRPTGTKQIAQIKIRSVSGDIRIQRYSDDGTDHD